MQDAVVACVVMNELTQGLDHGRLGGHQSRIDRGPLVVPGHPQALVLLHFVRDGQMVAHCRLRDTSQLQQMHPALLDGSVASSGVASEGCCLCTFAILDGCR